MNKQTYPATSLIKSRFQVADNYLNAKEKIKSAFPIMHVDTPFSQRLNIFVENWFEENKEKFTIVDHDEFEDSDSKTAFINMVERFENTGKIQVVRTNFPTVFGSSEIYDKFRAWHDYMHIQCNCGFDVASESIVSIVQASKLPTEWIFEREMINAQITGTNQYYKIHKDYVVDQRQFIADYLNDPYKAIFNKQ